jgi:type VI secretion system protein ImpA
MSDQLINVEQLLAPISAENPSGVELSLTDLSGPYLRIKDAYDEAKKLVKEQIDKETSGGLDRLGKPWRVIPTPDWNSIVQWTSEAIAGNSKDFRLAAWLTEALLRIHGIRGLRDGLLLCKGLCERYWPSIHPAPDEENGHTKTVGPFSGLVQDSTFPAILGSIIVEGAKQGERTVKRFTVLDFLRSKDGKEPAEDENFASPAEFRSIAEVTSPEFHAQNLAVVSSCIESINWLGDFLKQNCQADEYDEPSAPGVDGIRNQLELVQRAIMELSGGDKIAETESTDESNTTPSGSSKPSTMTRESAFQTIEEIARFFERTEPHTPVHFALRQVVRWGRMPLPDLLAELIEDDGTRDTLGRLIGLPKKQDN